MSRASRRESRESAKRAHNPKTVTVSPINRHSSTYESREERISRIRGMLKQNKLAGDK